MTATLLDDLARINAMFNATAPLLDQLSVRWDNEKEYEDFNEYKAAVERQLPDGFKLEKMSKRPFGFEFSIGTEARYLMSCTRKAIGWKRVK